MRVAVAVAALGAAVNVVRAADLLPEITDNPLDAIYTATLPQDPFFHAPELDGNVRGFISAAAPPDGVGVRFTVRFENLPKTGGPFAYHLHVNKASNGNCTATGAHLDPTNRGEKPPCDAGSLPSCQAGDLAGKYGKITSDPFIVEYVDKFVSLKEGDATFFGNRSFVIHLANSTRITCADFVKNEPNIPSAPLAGSTSRNNQTYYRTETTTYTQPCACSDQQTSCTTTTATTSTSTTFTTPTRFTPAGTGVSSSGVVGPTPSVVLSATAGRRVPGPLLWWVGGVALVIFSH
ncbi:Superoxide dismutase, copper/zinc binding domain protein [Metarhizium guizhouense ARSEF 977]|uniref:superoxide dismutase n=1 Tax=Metarhizium guizhouense (strain ARSEF 977) TaxID=1276136 RepID=A0A0B4GRZ2_METGA|nr:Superoxide dismutase, copper/zinc binding domain protein [Metarhizium guizhouense ARSEF 977]